MSLHQGEVPVPEAVVRALLAEQAPALAGLPLRRLASTGTVNHVFRLGDDLLVRLPRLPDEDAEREAGLLALVAPGLPVAVPEVMVLGDPGRGYPFRWLVVRWIDGAVPAPGEVPWADLAAAVLALRRTPLLALPSAGRPAAADADGDVQAAIDRLDDVDRDEVRTAWAAARGAPSWDGRRVPIHADLLPPNLVVADGRLVGILDWAGAGAGDPANDLVPAWSCLRGADRERYLSRLGAPPGERDRARGIALAQAVVAIPYYERTNPAFVALNRATLAEVLAEHRFASR